MQFTLKTQLPASPQAIYTAWLSSAGHTAMIGGSSEATDKVGAPFTAWDGYISGKNLQLEPHNRIVQSWRTTEFSDAEPDSQIEILLEAVDGGTDLTLIHTNVPPHGEQYIKGWEDHYFTPMKAYFSAH